MVLLQLHEQQVEPVLVQLELQVEQALLQQALLELALRYKKYLVE
jgi:hypothetical protein